MTICLRILIYSTKLSCANYSSPDSAKELNVIPLLISRISLSFFNVIGHETGDLFAVLGRDIVGVLIVKYYNYEFRKLSFELYNVFSLTT